jgi:hypothetical protein
MHAEEANVIVRFENDFRLAGEVKSTVNLVFLVQTWQVKFDVVMGRLSNCFPGGSSRQSPVVVVLLFLLADISGLVDAVSVLNPRKGNKTRAAFARVKSRSS